jgi:hypothetical protein
LNWMHLQIHTGKGCASLKKKRSDVWHYYVYVHLMKQALNQNGVSNELWSQNDGLLAKRYWVQSFQKVLSLSNCEFLRLR